MKDFEHHITKHYAGYENTVNNVQRDVNLLIEECDRIKNEKILKNRTDKEQTEIKNKDKSNFRIKRKIGNVTKISNYLN